MKYRYNLSVTGGVLNAMTITKENGVVRTVEKVVTASGAARALGKSLRHIYRYIENGTLRPAGKLLGEWLFDAEEVEQFRNLSRVSRPPGSLPPLPHEYHVYFPEYAMEEMNLWTNAPVVITRQLDTANRKAWRWVFGSYPNPLIGTIITRHGARLMDPRSAHYWAWLLKVPLQP